MHPLPSPIHFPVQANDAFPKIVLISALVLAKNYNHSGKFAQKLSDPKEEEVLTLMLKITNVSREVFASHTLEIFDHHMKGYSIETTFFYKEYLFQRIEKLSALEQNPSPENDRILNDVFEKIMKAAQKMAELSK